MLVEEADERQLERTQFERGLADYLIQCGKLETTALDRALRLQAGTEETLEALLVKLGFANERDIAQALADRLRLPIADTADYPVDPILEDRVNESFLAQARVIPLTISSTELSLAMIDPLDAYTDQAMRMASGLSIRRLVAIPSEFESAFARLYRPNEAAGRSSNSDAHVNGDEDLLEDADRLRDLASEGPVIRLVSQLIAKAIETRASDIHIEPFQNRLGVRYRIDGLLRDMPPPASGLKAAIISRLKIMAKLNIAERRLPQDGRMRVTVRGTDFDLRVSTTPTLYGESVVMRILDRASLVEDLPSLGFSGSLLDRFIRILDQPQGILLVTGPTGSGKTTTLYTALMRLHAPDKKLFTVEDPIEYQLDGVNQIQVKPKIGLGFAQILRSILRQDPDIVMIGEMRDLETAQIAIQAALTGHLVLSTLHTNSAAASVTRLLDMGVNNYLVTSTVNAVLAQRLVRRLCPLCRQAYTPSQGQIEQFRLPLSATLYKACGCESCGGSGYRGRLAIIELLVVSDAIRRLVLQNAEAVEIQREAEREGMVSMYDDGLQKALSALTTVEEVLRVTRDLE